MSKLHEIIAHKRNELTAAAAQVPLHTLQKQAAHAPEPRDFRGVLQHTRGGWVRILAEIKRGSPSRGIIRDDVSPREMARLYADAGAAAISVLTDAKYFNGSPEHLREARAASGLPVLRKDFTLDAYHVWEARAMSADAVLLMCQVLGAEELQALLELTEELGMAALVESHSADELSVAVSSGASLLGINNRDLHTLDLDLTTTARLMPMIPAGRTVISQSGVNTRKDAELLAATGVDALQIGTSLMSADDPLLLLREIVGDAPE